MKTTVKFYNRYHRLLNLLVTILMVILVFKYQVELKLLMKPLDPYGVEIFLGLIIMFTLFISYIFYKVVIKGQNV